MDRDIMDEVMEKMKVKVRLASAGSPLDIAFSSLDDFHPDHILNRIGIFQALKDVRKSSATRAPSIRPSRCSRN
ncbi:MAG: type VI secretion system contractile sheath small subunit [Desulfobacterales bacterium]|nr:type VI secretion system contractile sheath small subunit [Desulfobacterales bacterium]